MSPEKRHKITPEERRNIADFCQTHPNVSLKTVGENHRVSRWMVTDILKEHGIKREPVRNFHSIELPVQELTFRYLMGASLRELEKEYPASRMTIKRRLSNTLIRLRKGNTGGY